MAFHYNTRMRRRFPICYRGRFLLAAVALGLLTQCATSHQPVPFDPYFGVRQAAYTGPELLAEMAEMEKKEDPSRFDRKRLYDLYQAELAYLKPGSPRYASLLSQAATLKQEIEKWEGEKVVVEKETKELAKRADSKAAVGPKPMSGAEWKKPYSELMQLWNKEQQEMAQAKLDGLLNGGFANASKADRNKFLQIGFRMALEQGNLKRAGELYTTMNDNEHCGYETATSGFLYALVLFGEGREADAEKVYEDLCEIDDSASEKIRRDYWKARLIAKSQPEESRKLLERIAALPIPGYHTFLAIWRLERKYMLPAAVEGAPTRPYLVGELSVPGKVHEDWEQAESRLRANLRRDAQTYLIRASQRLRLDADEDAVPAMLYTAHLLHASGNHLEAMKLYSEIATALAENYDIAREEITPTVLADMFPRPNLARAEWVAKMWDMDPEFVYAIARQESAFNPTAVSVTDARGWMQLMPPLAKSLAKSWGLEGKFNERHLFHVDENLKFGVFHLRQLRDLLGHPSLIASAYNAGVSRAQNWDRRYGAYPLDIFIELIPITETRNYVKLVLRNFFLYKALKNGSVDPSIVSFQLHPRPSVP